MNVNNTELVLTAGNESQLIHDGLPQFAFSGRSNVGKSSLINTLLNRKKLARVSSEPGKTITINYYRVDKSLYLVDLPGYGYAKRSENEKKQWSQLVDSYVTGEDVTCIVQLIDLKVGITDDDYMMLEWMSDAGIPFFVVATKADKLNKTDRNKAMMRLATEPLLQNVPVVPFSALKKEGKDEVWKKILNMVQ
ncbi:MAG: YihA family ribosome biogenesis GTP-binding protein [Clostridia bacterium]|nr:YihA family ribosome biogenesis GTP-binding protein [Clostridia bacterium]